MAKTMQLKIAREKLVDTSVFEGGVFVTDNDGISKLYIETAEDRQKQIIAQEMEKQAIALLKLTLLAKKDVIEGNTYSIDQVMKKLLANRALTKI